MTVIRGQSTSVSTMGTEDEISSATSLRSIHQLKVSLRDIRPPIWRRIQVPSDISLGELHHVLQAAMGWDGGHLHMFSIAGKTYSDDRVEDPWGERQNDEDRTRLDKVAPLGARLRYDYDFGDDWRHDIVVEKILDSEPAVAYPRCLTGRRACPPEDCGGPWRYAYLLAAIADTNGTEDEELLQWVGGDFDPEAFDPAAVNALFARRFHR
ncbi:MAG: plasmid pRiA4b ORF-3 family protein [Ferrimicrobium sp.]